MISAMVSALPVLRFAEKAWSTGLWSTAENAAAGVWMCGALDLLAKKQYFFGKRLPSELNV